MPNIPVITPKTFAIILLASTGKEVSSFVIQLPQPNPINVFVEGLFKALKAT